MTAQEQLWQALVTDVAHELRTPVAVLQANTEALLDGVLAHPLEQTASLYEEVLRLGRMVEDLQTLAAAEAAANLHRSQPLLTWGLASPAGGGRGSRRHRGDGGLHKGRLPGGQAAGARLASGSCPAVVSSPPGRPRPWIPAPELAARPRLRVARFHQSSTAATSPIRGAGLSRRHGPARRPSRARER